jgi:hypothetical protein
MIRRGTLATAALSCLAYCTGCRPSAGQGFVVEPREAFSGPVQVVRMSDPRPALQLLNGWHGIENGQWRWTEKRFSVVLQPPAGSKATLRLDFALPGAIMAQLGRVTLQAAVGGNVLTPEVYSAAGAQAYQRILDASATLPPDSVQVDFTLDKALPPSAADARELGIIVSSVGFYD